MTVEDGVYQSAVKGRMDFRRALKESRKWIKSAQDLCAEQAEDEGLWFIAETAAEAYLQQELRRLHKILEEGPIA